MRAAPFPTHHLAAHTGLRLITTVATEHQAAAAHYGFWCAHIYLGTARAGLIFSPAAAVRCDAQGWQNIWQAAWQQWKMGIGHRVNLAPASAWDEKRAKKKRSRVQPTAFLIKEKCSGRESEFCAINKDVRTVEMLSTSVPFWEVSALLCVFGCQRVQSFH